MYCVICLKYRKSGKSKISYLIEKTLVLSIICSKCKKENEKVFKEKDSTEIIKIIGLFYNIKEY